MSDDTEVEPISHDQRVLMRGASYLLPDPGGEVVRILLDELDRVNAELERLRADAQRLDYVEREGGALVPSYDPDTAQEYWVYEKSQEPWTKNRAPTAREAIDAAQQEGSRDE